MRWLGVVGIGEDGIAGLGVRARAIIARAEIVYGGARHLDLAGELIAGEARVWSSPLAGSLDEIERLRGRRVTVLASGDPFLFGIGATLSRTIGAEEMDVVPGASAFSLAAARLGWPLQDVSQVSAHGRPMALVLQHLQPGRRVFVLTSDAAGPAELARVLVENGFGQTVLTVLEALGGPQERVRSGLAEGFALDDVQALNLCAIEVVAGPGARVLARVAGLDDLLFEHDGQITKREVRAVTLSALAPRRGELLWDIGAGAGSIGIEWMLADPSLRAIAIESDRERAGRIGRNALAFGAPELVVIEGRAPEALAGLAAPDAIFIGGGGSGDGMLDMAVSALKSGGRLVANAVTLEFEAVLLAAHERLGGALTRIEIARASPVGTMNGWRPAMPVTQWVWSKP